jgi:hypothetical protein
MHLFLKSIFLYTSLFFFLGGLRPPRIWWWLIVLVQNKARRCESLLLSIWLNFLQMFPTHVSVQGIWTKRCVRHHLLRFLGEGSQPLYSGLTQGFALAKMWWCRPAIPANQEAKTGGLRVWGQPVADPISKTKCKLKSWSTAQVIEH